MQKKNKTKSSCRPDYHDFFSRLWTTTYSKVLALHLNFNFLNNIFLLFATKILYLYSFQQKNDSIRPPLPQLSLRRRQAQTVRDKASSHKIDNVAQL